MFDPLYGDRLRPLRAPALYGEQLGGQQKVLTSGSPDIAVC